MKAIKRIALTELQTMFYSPIAWFILIIFTFQASMTFVNAFEGYVVSQELGRYVYNVTMIVSRNSRVFILVYTFIDHGYHESGVE